MHVIKHSAPGFFHQLKLHLPTDTLHEAVSHSHRHTLINIEYELFFLFQATLEMPNVLLPQLDDY